MKKIVIWLIVLLLTLIMFFIPVITGCTKRNYISPSASQKERPHLYWKDIDVEIIDIDEYYNIFQTEVSIKVKSDEYGISNTLTYYDLDWCYDYEVGDIIKAEMYTYKMDSTGEIISREIHRIY